ncbi:hypothetical protein ACPZ19_24880 [Amycolatopsis lurida]
MVALGYNDLAVATAMGLNVVGAVKGYEPGVPQAPYLSKQLGPEVLTLDMNGISFEQVAAYRPDVILAWPASRTCSGRAGVQAEQLDSADALFQAVTSDTAQALQAPNVAAVKWLLDQLRPTLTRIGQV